MEESNADQFLALYRRLENHLQKEQQEDATTTFRTLLSKSENRAVNRYHHQLKRYGDLRNSIVHHEYEEKQPIADPRQDVIDEFREIVESVTNPPGLSPFLREVYTATPSDDIGEVVEKMETENFSQMPIIQDEEVIAVLTTNTIARWVGAELHQDGSGLLVTETRVGDVLPHTEREDNYTFVPRTANLYEAYQAFQIEQNMRELPDAALITQNGRATESLLGIITPFDLPDLVRRL
jgi:predicted transcriptional regulator